MFIYNEKKDETQTPKKTLSKRRHDENTDSSTRETNMDKNEKIDFLTTDNEKDQCVSYDDEKMAYSQPIMFQSQGDMRESIETRAMDLGLDTINVIEHMDQLNSAVGILLNKNSKYSYVCYDY